MDDRVYWTVWTILLLAPWAVILTSMCAVAHMRRRQLDRLDALWGWVGEGMRHLGSGREWVGTIDGRKVDVEWFEDTTRVKVAAQPKLKAGFGREDEPQNVVAEALNGGHAYTIDGGEVGYAENAGEVGALVRQPGVEDALRILLAKDGESLRMVEVDPKEGVSWLARNLPERMFGREDTERWVQTIVRLARAAETVPA